MNEIIEIRIDQLKPGDNPREIDFKNDPDTENLLSTMEKVGFEGIDPILVYPTDNLGAYEIDDGHRRFHCAAKMEWKRLRAIVVPRPRTEADRFFKRGLRNLNQKKLTNGELTRFVGRLYHDFEWTQEKIAEQTNLSQGYVSELSCIYNFPILLEYIDNNGQMMIAKELAKVNDVIPMQSLIEQGCTVDSVKQYRESIKRKEKEEDAEKPKETTLEEEKEESEEEEPEGEEEDEDHTDEEKGEEKGGEPGKAELKTSDLDDDANSPLGKSEVQLPESSPSKPWQHGSKCIHCGEFIPDGIDHVVKVRNQHEAECDNGNPNYGNDWKEVFVLAENLNRMHPFSHKKGIPAEYRDMHPKERDAARNNIELTRRECKMAIQFIDDFENAKSKIGGS